MAKPSTPAPGPVPPVFTPEQLLKQLLASLTPKG